jgi:hypothetical protein
MRRRALLAAVPAALAGGTAISTAMPPSPIMALFAEWSGFHEQCAGLPLDATDEHVDYLCEKMRAIERTMMRIPPRSIEELAVKVVVATDFGSTPWMGPPSHPCMTPRR